jgi:WD40 repeat protein
MSTQIWMRAITFAVGTLLMAGPSYARKGDPSEEYPIAASPDGKLIAAGDAVLINGSDRKVRLIDLATQKEIRRLELPGGEHDALSGLTFSPDGKLLAWVGVGQIHLFDAATGKRVGLLKGRESGLRAVAFDSSGTLIARGCADKHIDIWTVKEALAAAGSVEPTRRLGPHTGPVRSMTFGRALDTRLLSSSNNTVFVWDPNSGKGNEAFVSAKEPISSLACAPNDSLLATVEGRRICLRTFHRQISNEFTPMGTIQRQVEEETEFVQVLFAPNGKAFAASDKSSIWVWETASGKRLAHLVPEILGIRTEWEPPKPLVVHSFTFTPVGQKLVATVDSGEIFIWNTVNSKFELVGVIGTTKVEAKAAAPSDKADSLAALRQKAESLFKEADDLRKAGRLEEAQQLETKAAQRRRELNELLRQQVATDEPSDNLVINGSFEQRTEGEPSSDCEILVPGSETLVGWQCTLVYPFGPRDIDPVYRPVEWIGDRRWRASHGQQCLDLDGKIGQELPTTPGAAYRVRFDMAGNPESGPRRQHLRVTIDEHSFDFEFDSRGTSTQYLGWKTKEISFIAKGDKTILAFTNVKPNKESAGVALDHVVVQQLDRADRRPGEPVPADVTDKSGLFSR